MSAIGLDRITHLGMLEDLRLHNADVTETKQHLTNVIFPTLASIILGYVFEIPGIISNGLIDQFRFKSRPNLFIDKYSINLKYSHYPGIDSGLIDFTVYENGEEFVLTSCDIRVMWNMFMKRINKHNLLLPISIFNLVGQLDITCNFTLVSKAVFDYCNNLLDDYVTPA